MAANAFAIQYTYVAYICKSEIFNSLIHFLFRIKMIYQCEVSDLDEVLPELVMFHHDLGRSLLLGCIPLTQCRSHILAQLL